jgi:hypothetical protein
MTPEQQSADIKARQARMMQASNQRPTARRA